MSKPMMAGRFGVGFGFLFAASVGAAGCGQEPEAADFTTSNRDGFVAACAQTLDDPRLVTDVCRCVIDRAEAEVDYERFVDLDSELSADPEAELPPEVIDMISECFVELSGLADIASDNGAEEDGAEEDGAEEDGAKSP